MALTVCGVLVLQRHPRGLGRAGVAWLGVIFGLVLLTKEVAFYVLALPAVFLLLGQPRDYRRLLPGLGGSGTLSLAIYALYPDWAFWSGNGSEFLRFKLYQFQRFQGLVQISGWNRPSAATPGARPPTFVEALGVNLPTYGTSYALILLGGVLGLYLLLRSRDDADARLLGAWGLLNNLFFAYTIVQGQLNDQFFYLLLVPTAAIVGYSVPLLLRRPFARLDWRAALRVPLTTLVVLALPALFFYNSTLYYTNYAVGVDDGYRQVHDYLVAHVPTGSPLLIGSDTGIHVFPEYHTYLERTPEAVRSRHIHYFVLSSKDAWGRYNGVTQEFYDWVTGNSIELFALDEPTFWRLGVYYMAYPDEYRTTTSAGPGRAEPPALTPLQLAARPIPPVVDTIDQRYFTATGHTLGGVFKRYWETRGALLLFGYPLTEAYTEDGRLVQYFERARLDYYPEFAGTDRQVQPALLGRELTQVRQAQEPFRPVAPADVDPQSRFFAPSGHSLGEPFRLYWEQYGGQELFGLPISEVLTEINPTDGLPYQVQYFERARFEYHPENAGTPNAILLGLLGRQAMIYRGWQP
jgi:hypothetical protein